MPRPKQSELPVEGDGVAPKKIKAIEVAADDYVEKRDTRMGWTKKEVESRDRLAGLMKEHGLSTYRFADEEVVIKEGKVKVKVKKIDGTETEDDDDEDQN